ncbi:MAG: hypothetical protein CM1200mP28_03530 [Deltaproteobacteria bacterium]|nr:MAG: hypothetical protein CM1200mP28_03530 [Deltaproteobacteria bacterium]
MGFWHKTAYQYWPEFPYFFYSNFLSLSISIFFLFNLIPLGPLDGTSVIPHFLHPNLRIRYQKLEFPLWILCLGRFGIAQHTTAKLQRLQLDYFNQYEHD